MKDKKAIPFTLCIASVFLFVSVVSSTPYVFLVNYGNSEYYKGSVGAFPMPGSFFSMVSLFFLAGPFALLAFTLSLFSLFETSKTFLVLFPSVLIFAIIFKMFFSLMF